MKLLLEKFRDDKRLDRSQESLKRIIYSVRENHGAMLKGKRRRPDTLSVYFSWYMEKFEGTEKKYTQIRLNSGGGVKQKLMARNANYETCFQTAKNAFLPNGKNDQKLFNKLFL